MTPEALYVEHEVWAIAVGLRCAQKIVKLGRVPRQFVSEYAEQAARVGLWESCVRWVPGTARFKTFARYRVGGEVKDEATRLYGVSFSRGRKSQNLCGLPGGDSEIESEKSCGCCTLRE